MIFFIKLRLQHIAVWLIAGSAFVSCNDSASPDYTLQKGGSLLWYNQPCGVYYENNHKRTYLAWLNINRNVEVCFFDEVSNKFSSKKTIKKWNYLDDHGQPVLHVKENGNYKGFIYILLNLHNSPLKFIRAKKPEDITDFTEEKLIDSGACTYPSVIETPSGELLIFYTKNIFEDEKYRTRALFFRRSLDDGDSWSEAQELINFGFDTWIYSVTPVIKSNVVHIAFSVKEAYSEKVKGVYYIRSLDYGYSWQGIDQSVLKIPVKSLKPLYQSSGNKEEVRVWDLKVEANQKPVIGLMQYNDTTACSMVARLHQDKINVVPVAVSKNIYYPSGIVIDEKNNSKVFTAESSSDRKVRITEKCYNQVTGKYDFVQYISFDTLKSQVRPQLIKNYKNLKLLWTEVTEYKDFQNFRTNLKAWFVLNPFSKN